MTTPSGTGAAQRATLKRDLRGADPHVTDAREPDVVLADGGTARLRPLRPSDADALVDFFASVSSEAKYLRFFGPHPVLSAAEVHELTGADQHDHVAVALWTGTDIVAIAQYGLVDALLPARVANVSFLVRDDQQGRGAANILLEHLAEIGRESDIERFTAEMLTGNRAMLSVFRHAGFSVRPEMADGFITVEIDLDPTSASRRVMRQREHVAESNAVRRLLEPRSVAVIGAAAAMADVVRHLADAGFTGPLLVSTSGDADHRAPAHDLAILGDADLVVVRSEDAQLREVVDELPRHGVRGLVMLAGNSTPHRDADGVRSLVERVRARGVRALGPASLGLVNTDPDVRLNASDAPMPRTGGVGVFAQSAGVAMLTLAGIARHDVGVSNLVAAGAFADVSGNDVMQFWTDDQRTRVCLLSLDAVGNPRKFFRILRRLSLAKPVVLFLPSRALLAAPSASDLPRAPRGALDQAVRQVGALVVDRRDTMLDVARLLAAGADPGGRRVRLISNSHGMAQQMRAQALDLGLVPDAPEVVPGEVDALATAAATALDNPALDAVVVCAVEVHEPLLAPLHERLRELVADGQGLLVPVLVGLGAPEHATDDRLPLFDGYGDALRALALVCENAEHRRGLRADDELSTDRPADDGRAAAGARAAREMVHEALAAHDGARVEDDLAQDDLAARLLAHYGIEPAPGEHGRPGAPAPDAAATGVLLRARAIEDAVLGPMVAIGPASAEQDDLAWAAAPLSRTEALQLARRALGTHSGDSPTIEAVADLVERLSHLTDDLPAVADLALPLVFVDADGILHAGAARLRLVERPDERDARARRLE